MSLGLALAIAGVLQVTGFVVSTLLIGVALHDGDRDADADPPRRRRAETPLGRYTAGRGCAGGRPIIAISLLLSQAATRGSTWSDLSPSRWSRSGSGVLALRARPGRVVRTIERTMNSSGQFAGAAGDPILCRADLPHRPRFGLDVVLGAFAAGIVVGLVTKHEEASPCARSSRASASGSWSRSSSW